MNIVMLGMPSPVGGAHVERGHTALLWRKLGLDVTVIATCKDVAGNPWPVRLMDAGCQVIRDPGAVHRLRDSLCVAFCCCGAVQAWPALRERGCKLIWSPCMNHQVHGDIPAFSKCQPSAVHFQSKFQAGRLGKLYDGIGVTKQFVIHGAFDDSEFAAYGDNRNPGRFVIGKLARPYRQKWPADLWDIIGRVRQKVGSEVEVSALCMGWGHDVEIQCGRPPSWAECLPANSIGWAAGKSYRTTTA